MRRVNGLETEITGEGEPVILIHGSHVAAGFAPLMGEPALAERYQLARYHRRGFAGSAPHEGPFAIEDQARDALELARALGLERFHAVGHSYGAVTALQLALDAPDAVATIALLEPPIPTEATAPAMTAMFEPLVQRYRSGDASGAVEQFMETVAGPGWREAIARHAPEAPQQAERDASTFFEVELPALQAWRLDEGAVRRMRQPTLFAIGSESGPLFEAPKEYLLALAPQIEEVVLPGLDHLLQVRDPGLVAGHLASFLDRHPL